MLSRLWWVEFSDVELLSVVLLVLAAALIAGVAGYGVYRLAKKPG